PRVRPARGDRAAHAAFRGCVRFGALTRAHRRGVCRPPWRARAGGSPRAVVGRVRRAADRGPPQRARIDAAGGQARARNRGLTRRGLEGTGRPGRRVLRIALMGRSLRPPLTGIGRYTVNLARALEEFVDPASLSLYVTRDAAAATAG